MSCGKRPLVKKWDKPKKIPVIAPSRYEKNEASVKMHWRKIMRDLELSYKDEQFWESQCDTVRELVGPHIFYRIAKIFDLPFEGTKYEPKSESSSLVDSALFYESTSSSVEPVALQKYSISDYEPSVEEETELEENSSDGWSVSSGVPSIRNRKQKSNSTTRKSVSRLKSLSLSRNSKLMSKSFSKFLSKALLKSYSSKTKSLKSQTTLPTETTTTDDDLDVHCSIKPKWDYGRRDPNPHFELLYCNESETDMIRWNSKYKQKTFEVSASDQFSKKAEILTKKIAFEFFEWWTGLGNVEFKSEIKRPEDIEDLFQVWFDEHASRGLVLHPKVLPCVLSSIANYLKLPKAACPEFLKRQIASDILAETSPAHLMAFNTCLPQKMKHIPPKNNTKEQWGPIDIPEDLRTMACVWDDVQHLTSTKAFQKWLEQRPYMPMPECLRTLDGPDHDKKQLFVVPSDYIIKEGSAGSASAKELALPVSQMSIQLKDVISRLMNQE